MLCQGLQNQQEDSLDKPTNPSHCPRTFRAVACDSMPLLWPQNTGCFENLQGRNGGGGAFASCVRVSSLTSSVQKQRLNTTVARVSPPAASLHRTFWYQIGSPVLGTTRLMACRRKVTQQSKRISFTRGQSPRWLYAIPRSCPQRDIWPAYEWLKEFHLHQTLHLIPLLSFTGRSIAGATRSQCVRQVLEPGIQAAVKLLNK